MPVGTTPTKGAKHTDATIISFHTLFLIPPYLLTLVLL